jgi:uncharacterized damage-inducible protein DinB
MNATKYETANSWMSAMHEEGHKVSIMLCQAIEKKMKAEKISFSEAFDELQAEKRIDFDGENYELKETE